MIGRWRWIVLVACWLPGVAWGAEGIPTNITADTMMLEHAKHTAVFTGHVVLLRKDFKLWSDRLVVHYDAKNSGELRAAEAYGHVRIVRGHTRGSADQARYDQKKAHVVLIGHAVLQEPGRTVRGARIVQDLRKKATKVEPLGQGRVHLHLDGENKAPAAKGKP